MTSDKLFLRKLGARILSEANDLKRTPAALARDLGLPASVIEAAIAGNADLSASRGVLTAMAEAYPISLADIWLELDDTENGVRIMSAEQSRASGRVFDRKDGTGALSPYYEYRDTAMSRLAPFKPEWIEELRVVDNAQADNPDVAFNRGHFLHQTTFFIGPVNFYWEVDGQRYCAEMDTGDSNYITPFVPHSFTSRYAQRHGLIIAITYGGEVRRAFREFSAIDGAALLAHAGDLAGHTSFAVRLKRQLAAETLPLSDFVSMVAKVGLDEKRITTLLEGVTPSWPEVEAIARILNIRPADLLTASVASDEQVVVRRGPSSPARRYPDGNNPAYALVELARSSQQPLLKGFDVTVLGGTNGDMRHALHEYVYNYGREPVDLVWSDDARRTLMPGDSAYVLPLVRHRFDRAPGAGEGKLVMIRVPGALTDAVLDEFASFAPGGRARAIEETNQWF